MTEVSDDLAGWTDLSLEQPPEHCAALLVTNNIRARNAFGHMSHLWLVSMVHGKDGDFCAFSEDGFRKVESLTHWRYAVPAEGAHRIAGQAELLELLDMAELRIVGMYDGISKGHGPAFADQDDVVQKIRSARQTLSAAPFKGGIA